MAGVPPPRDRQQALASAGAGGDLRAAAIADLLAGQHLAPGVCLPGAMAGRRRQQPAAYHDVPEQLCAGRPVLLLQPELDVAGDDLAARGDLRHPAADRHAPTGPVPGAVPAAGGVADSLRLQTVAGAAGPGGAGGVGRHRVRPRLPADRSLRRPLAVHGPAVVLPGPQPLQRPATDPGSRPGRGLWRIVPDRNGQWLADRADRTPDTVGGSAALDATAKEDHRGRGDRDGRQPGLRHRAAQPPNAPAGGRGLPSSRPTSRCWWRPAGSPCTPPS